MAVFLLSYMVGRLAPPRTGKPRFLEKRSTNCDTKGIRANNLMSRQFLKVIVDFSVNSSSTRFLFPLLAAMRTIRIDCGGGLSEARRREC